MKSRGSLARNAPFGAPISHKMGGRFRVSRDRPNTLDACHCKCVVVSWQAQTALCDVAFRDVVAGTAFCDVLKVLFQQIAVAGTRKRDTFSNIVAGAAFRKCLEKWWTLRKSHTFSAL